MYVCMYVFWGVTKKKCENRCKIGKKISELGYELLPSYPPYYTNLGSSGYFPFAGTGKWEEEKFFQIIYYFFFFW